MDVLGAVVRAARPAAGLLALLGAVACYSPDVRDCTVTCTAETDCASGQVCGSDHFCAAPVVAGHCASRSPQPDAAVLDARRPATDAGPPRDAPPHDAAPPDAPALVHLHLKIDGKGHVTVDGSASCADDCDVVVPAAVPATLVAVPDPHQMFDRWTTAACAGQGPTCTLTPLAATDVGVKFEKDH